MGQSSINGGLNGKIPKLNWGFTGLLPFSFFFNGEIIEQGELFQLAMFDYQRVKKSSEATIVSFPNFRQHSWTGAFRNDSWQWHMF